MWITWSMVPDTCQPGRTSFLLEAIINTEQHFPQMAQNTFPADGAEYISRRWRRLNTAQIYADLFLDN